MDYKVENHLHPYVFEDIKTITDSNINWPCLCNKTVLITGGNGFIAFYLVCAMLIRNAINPPKDCNFDPNEEIGGAILDYLA